MQVDHYLKTGEQLPEPELNWVESLLQGHLQHLYDFYGEYQGVRIARKHIAWYSRQHQDGAEFRRIINKSETAEAQQRHIRQFFEQQLQRGGLAA